VGGLGGRVIVEGFVPKFGFGCSGSLAAWTKARIDLEVSCCHFAVALVRSNQWYSTRG
jgi:hypothetical protein